MYQKNLLLTQFFIIIKPAAHISVYTTSQHSCTCDLLDCIASHFSHSAFEVKQLHHIIACYSLQLVLTSIVMMLQLKVIK